MSNIPSNLNYIAYKNITLKSYNNSSINYQTSPTSNSIKDNRTRKENISLIFSIAAFLMFFAAVTFAISFFLHILNLIKKSHSNHIDLARGFIYFLPILGGICILIWNHKARYTKPFNDGILFLSTALSAYFLLDKNIPFRTELYSLLQFIFGVDYQFATSLFIATCLIGKALIAFAEFFYEQRKHISRNFS